MSTYCEPFERLYGSINGSGEGFPLLTYGEAMPNKVLGEIQQMNQQKKSSRK
ncbi:TPA: hypothetical protein QDB40_002028 [Burkholderia vietnamiensis]|nr:hypothetical protein [Burkholderia vietnamiensis]